MFIPDLAIVQSIDFQYGKRKAQAPLTIFGSQGVASEVLNGKRGISKAQAKALGEFFKVSPRLFFD